MRPGAYRRLAVLLVLTVLCLWLTGCGQPEEESGGGLCMELPGTVVREEHPVFGEGEFFILPAEGQWLSGGELLAVSRSETAEEKPSAFSAFILSKNAENGQNTPNKPVFANSPGYFSRYTDGLEGIVPGEIIGAVPQKYENCLGKLVDGNCWYFAALLRDGEREIIENVNGLTLDGKPAQIWYIEDGFAVFRIKSGVDEHLTDRERTLVLEGRA